MSVDESAGRTTVQTTAPENEEPAGSRAGSSRSKVRRWVLVAVLLAIVVVVASGIAALARYQPLSASNWAGCGPGKVGPYVERPTYREGGICVVGFSLFNDGVLPVRVIGIEELGGEYGLLTLDYVRMARPGAGGQTAPGSPVLEPLAPFSLGHGGSRWIALTGRFGNCARWAPTSSQLWLDAEVTYEVLGFTKHQAVLLPMSIEVKRPATCPESASPAA